MNPWEHNIEGVMASIFGTPVYYHRKSGSEIIDTYEIKGIESNEAAFDEETGLALHEYVKTFEVRDSQFVGFYPAEGDVVEFIDSSYRVSSIFETDKSTVKLELKEIEHA